MFTDDVVPLRASVSRMAQLEGMGERAVFFLDEKRLSPEELSRVMQWLVSKRGMPPDIGQIVLRDGLPIRAELLDTSGLEAIDLRLLL